MRYIIAFRFFTADGYLHNCLCATFGGYPYRIPPFALLPCLPFLGDFLQPCNYFCCQLLLPSLPCCPCFSPLIQRFYKLQAFCLGLLPICWLGQLYLRLPPLQVFIITPDRFFWWYVYQKKWNSFRNKLVYQRKCPNTMTFNFFVPHRRETIVCKRCEQDALPFASTRTKQE